MDEPLFRVVPRVTEKVDAYDINVRSLLSKKIRYQVVTVGTLTNCG